MNMKLRLFIFLLSAIKIVPTEAMLARVSPIAAQSLFARTAAPAISVLDSSSFRLSHNPTLLARRLATQHIIVPSDNEDSQQDNQSEDNRQDQSGQQSWWQRFRSGFARKDNVPMLGISLFGYHAFWTNGDICQTPEDFHNPEKLRITKEYYLANGPDTIVRLFVQNFETLKNDPHACKKVLEFLAQTFDSIKGNPKLIEALEQLAVNNISLLKNNTSGKELLNAMLTHCPLFPAKLALCGLPQQSSTQSSKHFNALQKINFDKLKNAFPADDIHAQAFTDMIKAVLKNEEIEAKAGNYTFIHAYPWHIRFLQDLDAQLRSITYAFPGMPLSLRFIKMPSKDTLAKSFTVRSALMQNGTLKHYTEEAGAQKHMIFLNHSLFANERRANSVSYIAEDRGGYPPQLLLDKIFHNLGLEAYLVKYKTDIEELQELHRDASSFGAGLLFSFTPEMLQESVYVCSRGGPKREVFIEGIGTTDNIKCIIDTLRSTPEKIRDLDTLEFVFVVTKDCGLNPIAFKDGHVKWIPFNAADIDKLALYEQRRDNLINKIKSDIAAERMQWTGKKADRFLAYQQDISQWFENNFCLNDCNKGGLASTSRVELADDLHAQTSFSLARQNPKYWLKPKSSSSHKRIGSVVKSSSSKADPKKLIASIKNEYPHLKKLFGMPASQGANHSLEKHTSDVLQQLHQQIGHYAIDNPCYHHITKNLEQLLTAMIIVHDIGKPLGHRAEQHTFTMPIARKALQYWGFNKEECALAIALIDHDMLGELAQENTFDITPEQAYDRLQKLANEVGLTLQDFFRLQMLFFVSDASSYRHIKHRAFIQNAATKQLIPRSKRLNKLVQMIDPDFFKKRY